VEVQAPATALEERAWPIAPAEEPARPIAREAPVLVREVPIASAAAMFRAVARETAAPLEVAPGDSTDPARAATAIGVLAVSDLAAAEEAFGVAAVEASEAVAEAVAAVAAVVGDEDLGS
jgi:hypothetical protein